MILFIKGEPNSTIFILLCIQFPENIFYHHPNNPNNINLQLQLNILQLK